MLQLTTKIVIWIALIVLLAQLTFAKISYALPVDFNSLPEEALSPKSPESQTYSSPQRENLKLSPTRSMRLNNSNLNPDGLIRALSEDYNIVAPNQDIAPGTARDTAPDIKYDLNEINEFDKDLYGDDPRK